jgi:hypothetical protein
VEFSQATASEALPKYFRPEVAVLVILYWAWPKAEDEHADVWQHAVERCYFEKAGVPLDAVCRVLAAGLIDFRDDETDAATRRRKSRPRTAEEMPLRCSFVLTRKGANRFGSVGSAVEPVPAVAPVWDAEHGRLTAGGWLVKSLPIYSKATHEQNQMKVLAVFQEDGWATEIDDPLTPATEWDDPGDRRRNTTRSLNDHQVVPLLWFQSYRGEWFRWGWILPRGWHQLLRR